MKKYCFFLYALVFFSCSSQHEIENVELINFTDPLHIEDDIKDWIQIEKSVQLAIPDFVFIGKVTQIEFSDSELFFLEDGINASILVFDIEGNFRNQLIKPGTGPGEYSQIEFFVLREKSILVYDRSMQKLIDYSRSGFSVLQEYKRQDYFVGGIGLSEDRTFLVSDSDLELDIYKGYGFFNSDLSQPIYRMQPAGYVEAFLPQSISQIQKQILLVQPFSEKVFRIEMDSLKLTHQLDFGSKKIPAEASFFSDAEDLYESLANGSYYFATHNLLFYEGSVGFNFYNENVDNLNFGLIQNGKAYRFSIDSDLKELFLKPIAVREGLFHTVLLPGEYDEKVIELLNLTEVDYEKPILVSYTIGQ